jgi:hypothetical protein
MGKLMRNRLFCFLVELFGYLSIGFVLAASDIEPTEAGKVLLLVAGLTIFNFVQGVYSATKYKD